jgi:hypothetical protein
LKFAFALLALTDRAITRSSNLLKLTLTSDELVLTIIALVRRVNPTMLKMSADGFDVDFTPLAGKSPLSADEQLLIRLRDSSESESTAGQLDLNTAEAHSLSLALERLEALQSWPQDVLNMSRTLRQRLDEV